MICNLTIVNILMTDRFFWITRRT